MAIRVSDIIKLDSFKTIKLIAGEKGVESSVEWIYIAECFEDPLESIQWIQGGELVFITGSGIKGNLSILNDFIKGIKEKRGVGLIVNVGPYIGEIPEDTIALANELNIPLMEMPWEVKLSEISKEVSKAIIMSRMEENSLSHFLSNLLFGDGDIGEDAINKAAYFGYDLSGECCTCEVDVDKFEAYLKRNNIKDESSISKLKIRYKKIVQDTLEKNGLKVPLIDKGDSVIFINKSDTGSMGRLGRAISDIRKNTVKYLNNMTVSIGIGNSYKELNMMKQSLKEAEIAIESIKCKGLDDTCMYYKDSGVYALLFNIQDKNVLKNFYFETLGPILTISEGNSKDGSYIQILETYLNENCNITAASEKLFVHRNTLKYKINKIEELLECDLHDFNQCIKLKIALYIRPMLEI